jgi:hypothetical protein
MGAAHRAIAKEAPGYDAYMIVGILSYLFFGVAGIVLGIGVLKLSPLARKLAMAVTVINVLWFFASQAYSVAFVVPAQTKFQKEQLKMLPNGADAAAAVEATSMIGVALVLGCGSGIELTIALLILIGLNTQSAKVAFGTVPPPQPEESDDDDRPRKKIQGYDDDDD